MSENADEALDEDLVNHYEIVQPGEEYYVPLSEVTTTSLWLGAYEPPDLNNTPNRHTNSENARSHIHVHHHHHGSGNNNGAGDGVAGGRDTPHTQNTCPHHSTDKASMVKSARFAQQPIPLTNLVVEASEVYIS